MHVFILKSSKFNLIVDVNYVVKLSRNHRYENKKFTIPIGLLTIAVVAIASILLALWFTKSLRNFLCMKYDL